MGAGIDNYEWLRDLDGWLRHDLLGSVPSANLLILVCERRFSLLDWRLDLGWSGRVEEWHLEPFTNQEVDEFLQRRGIISASGMTSTAHIPLTLALYADLVQKRLLSQDHIRSAQEAFSASLLREVIDAFWHEAINVLCLVSRVHLDFLNSVLTHPLSVADYRQKEPSSPPVTTSSRKTRMTWIFREATKRALQTTQGPLCSWVFHRPIG